jgi:tRNA-dihydrouridine synthase C
LPPEVPVSAKLRLGWESIDDIDENAAMAAEGGASWLTIHARTRTQGYRPPVFWAPVGRVRRALGLPIVANGDIWSLEDFRRCREITGCIHFMVGRGALARPHLPGEIARELGLPHQPTISLDWPELFANLANLYPGADRLILMRLKQWMKIAHAHGDFPWFDVLKLSTDWRQVVSSLQQ